MANHSHERPKRIGGSRLRHAWLPLALFAAASCSDGPPPTVSTAPKAEIIYSGSESTARVAPLPRPKPERPKTTRKQASTPQSKAPVPVDADASAQPAAAERWTIAKLVGMTESEARDRLGAPNFEEEEAPAKIWLYTARSCSVRVYFFPEVKSLVYRVLRYEVLGDGEPDLQNCAAEIREDSGAGSAAGITDSSTS